MRKRRRLQRFNIIKTSFRIRKITFETGRLEQVTFFSKKILLLGLIGIFIITTAIMTIQNAVYGSKLNNVTKKIQEVVRVNQKLHEHIASTSSLSLLESQALENGFIPVSKTVYISKDDSVAQLR